MASICGGLSTLLPDELFQDGKADVKVKDFELVPRLDEGDKGASLAGGGIPNIQYLLEDAGRVIG